MVVKEEAASPHIILNRNGPDLTTKQAVPQAMGEGQV